MANKPLESDWKIFQKRVPEWRERYLLRRDKEIVGILSDQSKTATKRFWNAKKRIREEARILVDCLDGHSRSKMEWYLRKENKSVAIFDGLKVFLSRTLELILPTPVFEESLFISPARGLIHWPSGDLEDVEGRLSQVAES